MQQDTEKTKVVFRKFPDSQVIAMFYEEPKTGLNGPCCNSYMTIGQHSAASINLVRWTKLATPEEYADLKEELESIGYNLDIRKRIQRR